MNPSKINIQSPINPSAFSETEMTGKGIFADACIYRLGDKMKSECLPYNISPFIVNHERFITNVTSFIINHEWFIKSATTFSVRHECGIKNASPCPVNHVCFTKNVSPSDINQN